MGKRQLMTRNRPRWWSPLLVGLACLLLPCVVAAVSELDYGLEQHLLRRIEIHGNTTFSDKQLKSILRIREPRRFYPLMLLGLSDPVARYEPHLLSSELQLIERFYAQRGFHQVRARLDSVVTDPAGQGDIVSITIHEGPRTWLDRLEFQGETRLPDDLLRRGLHYHEGVPAPADLRDLGNDIYTLRTRFWEHGYLRVRIFPELTGGAGTDSLRRSATLVYRIHAGKQYRIRTLRIEGERLTRPELIQRNLHFRSGDLFRWSAIVESQAQLLRTSLFRDVSFIPTDIDTVAGTTDLVLQVVERKPAFVEFGVGIGSRERVRLLTAWGHNNVGGLGQRLELRARNALNYEDVQRLTDGPVHPELNYDYRIIHFYPNAIGHIGIDTNLFLHRETRGESGLNLQTLGLSVGGLIHAGRRINSRLQWRVEQVDPSLHPDAREALRSAYEASDLRSSDTRVLEWLYTDANRDDPLRPTRGRILSWRLGVAGGPMGGDNSFWKVAANWHTYRRFPLGGVLAIRVGAGIVRPYGDSVARGADGVPYQERFFAGGVSSVRGYLERSLGPQITDQAELDSLELANGVPLPDRPARGGNYLLLTSVEWRFPLPAPGKWRLEGVAFLDGGNVWENAKDIRLRSFRLRSYPRAPDDPQATRLWDYRYSVGTGLRLMTPIGPVRLDVGFPLKRARLSDTETEDSVIYHFSLGYPF